MDNRKAMNAIFYVARTGCQWKALPRSLGRKSTVHDRFQEWRKAGVFERMWRESLLEYDEMKGIEWEWQAMDTTMTKAPLGGKKHRAQPHRLGEIGNQEEPPRRWVRCTHRARCIGGKQARHQAGRAYPGEYRR